MPRLSAISLPTRSWWAAIGAAVAVTLGAGGLVGVGASGGNPSTLVPITPSRILDTRQGEQVGSLNVAGDSAPLRLQVAGVAGVPTTGVTGVSLNVTVVDTRANDYGGYLSVYPCASAATSRPDVSTLNFTTGQTIANAVTVPVSDTGHICFYVYGTAHLLADVNGYYTRVEPPTTIDAYTSAETDELLTAKADQTDIDTLNTLVDTKANQTDLDTLDTQLDTKADSAILRRGEPSLPIIVDPTAFLVSPPPLTIGHDGRPVIAHFDNYSQRPEVATCQTFDCRAGVAIHEPPSVTSPTLAIGTDGHPLLAYRQDPSGDLVVSRCSTVDCSGAVTTSVVDVDDGTNDIANFVAMTIGADGNPVIAHYDWGANENLKVAVCSTADCSGMAINTTLDSVGSVGQYPSVVIGVDGNPIIAHQDFTNRDLKVAACTSPDCTGIVISTTVASTGNVGTSPSIAIGIDGKPIIAHYASDTGDLLLTRCFTTDCAGSTTTVTLDSTGDVGSSPEMAILRDGRPLIVYRDWTNERLKVVVCGTIDCSPASNAIWIVDADGNTGAFSAIAIGTNGVPIVAYTDTSNYSVKVASLWWVVGGR